MPKGQKLVQRTPCAAGLVPKHAGIESPRLGLMKEACRKAERARRRWRAADLAGNREAAHRARQLMLLHQAITFCLDPGTGEPA